MLTILEMAARIKSIDTLEQRLVSLEQECRALSGALKAAVDDFNDERTRRLAAERELDRRTVGNIRLGPRAQTDEEVAVQVKRFAESLRVTPLGTRHTSDPTDPRLGHGSDATPCPQNDVYLVLSESERAKGFLRPVRDTYRHVGALTQLEDDAGEPSHQVRTGGCGTTTTMGAAIAETYARDPWHYGSIYCVTCRKHRPLNEFVWVAGGESLDPSQWPDAVMDAVIARRKELGEG